MHIAKPPVPENIPFKVEIATEKLTGYELLGTNQILAEALQTGGNLLCSEIHIHVNYIWKEEELPQQ